jgi:outer membrane protein assembly factor BamB
MRIRLLVPTMTVVLLGMVMSGTSRLWAQSNATKSSPDNSERPAAQAGERAKDKGRWSEFLGPQRDGVSSETGLLNQWPAGGVPEVWRVAGGVGMSGIAIDDQRAVTLVQREERQWLLAVDPRTGKTLWKSDLAPAYSNPMGNGPRGTPTIAGELVLAYTGEGILCCVSAETGKKIWSQHVIKQLQGKEAEYGMACSPLVVDDHVVVFAAGPQATLAAYELATGKLVWKVGEDPIGYSSPTRLRLGGKDQIVAFAGTAALGVDAHKGTLLWRYPFETSFNCNIAAPLAVAGKLLLSAGENHGTVLLDFKPSDQGFETAEVWSSLGPKSVLRSEWQTPVLLNGYLYGMDNVGGAGPVTHLTCIEAATGKRMWQVPRYGKGNLIAAEGKLLLSTMNGEFVVARASPEKYQELGRQTVLGSTRQAPSLARGFVYLRDDREIVCLDVRGEAKSE